MWSKGDDPLHFQAAQYVPAFGPLHTATTFEVCSAMCCGLNFAPDSTMSVLFSSGGASHLAYHWVEP